MLSWIIILKATLFIFLPKTPLTIFMNSFWEYIFLGNAVRDWSIAIAIIVGSCLVLKVIRDVLVSRLRKLSTRTKTTLDDFIIKLIRSSLMPLAYVLAVYFGLQYLKLSPTAARVMHIAIMVVAAFFIIRAINSFISYIFNRAISGQEVEDDRKKQAGGILLIVNLVVWVIGIVFLIDNLGYDITTIVAGLGIGGIAIALAAQTILGDLFSYIVIFFDKPFRPGDFIVIDDKMGSVEYIGIKTTRIRTLGGEQLICSNTDLTNSRVHNFKRMQERRVVFSFGVEYDTSSEKLRKISGMVKEIITSKEDIRFDRAHFKSFGAYSLDFEVVYFVLSDDFNKYMDIQQDINLQLFELFEKEEIVFAFPTQTVLLQRDKEIKNLEEKPQREGNPNKG
jgi:small-conductance mechanosensitive channel